MVINLAKLTYMYKLVPEEVRQGHQGRNLKITCYIEMYGRSRFAAVPRLYSLEKAFCAFITDFVAILITVPSAMSYQSRQMLDLCDL